MVAQAKGGHDTANGEDDGDTFGSEERDGPIDMLADRGLVWPLIKSPVWTLSQGDVRTLIYGPQQVI